MKKKIFLAFVAMLLFCGVSFAAEKQVHFIYIHGANQGPAEDFQKCMDKMHPYIIKDFKQSEFISQHFLKGATIDENTSMLYWADKTHETKESIKKDLDASRNYTNGAVLGMKEFLAEILHDAIWIQKYSNMMSVVGDLHDMVMSNYNKGKQTVLIGYSAGTFITYQYMVNKFKSIRIANAIKLNKQELNLTDSDVALFEKYAPKYTCLSALVDSKVVSLDASGKLLVPTDKNVLEPRVINLKKQTELSCTPDDATIGIMNFGSPVTVFYPDLAKDKSILQLMELNMIRYLAENNKFFLTVSYAKDPFGIPYENLTYNGIQKKLEQNIQNNGGYAYNKILKGGHNLAVAHSMYWMKPGYFTKKLVKTFEEGYDNFYEVK